MRLASIYARVRGEAPSDELERELRAALDSARAAWPGLRVDDEAFATYAASRASGERVFWSDLYLAFACERGDAAALSLFESHVAADVKRALSRSVDAATLDDALQSARRDLFASGKIAQYDGRGPLKGFFRVSVLRLAVRAGEKQKRESPESEPLDLARVTEGDPELLLLKATTRDAFRAAFEEAVASLDPQEALVLRQHLVDELSIDDIGRLHRVHRATAARWVVKAKESLLERTRDCFRARVSGQECESAIRLISSQFDVSVKRLLVQAAEGA